MLLWMMQERGIWRRMTPKCYFLDTGLASYLTSWPSAETLMICMADELFPISRDAWYCPVGLVDVLMRRQIRRFALTY
ncbi:MAG TPA: hypothetical protein DCO86_03210 [Spirochaetaceae bacterium]|nr:hypothetical protein [Spirochaetaceae bacterium]